ncbi:4'-phosphopantetheinyl transferase superfamily protein [Lacrimispora sp. NSJ-141]|uniref:4'-phosphopantetheinyl transferase superfamily protein n=1 Tax=Lientehia hominis TaxID=2897778 RepID=A0AAP2W9Q9_9FIRM|nr:4'-phosphopantetheinyl transferase superfamily protein [Lientehia hominis]MCD2492024.1 4'-phosphopantetheinyl transferase superfamily protein [Lientehia hominis]
MTIPDAGIYIFCLDDGRTAEDRLRLSAEAFQKMHGLREKSGAERPDKWKTARTEKGKPYFPLCPFLQFSISHSGTYWVCAFAEEPVGIDLQEHTKKNDETMETAASRYRKLAGRFLHPYEASYVQEQTGNSYDRFFRIWAAKESYVKYTGSGIDGRFGEISVLPEDGNADGVFKNLPEENGIRVWKAAGAWFHEVPFLEDYSLCVCMGRQAGQALFTCTGPAFHMQSIF